jgi:hypothetical protein
MTFAMLAFVMRFHYPKNQARLLAQAAGQSVLTTRAETTKSEQTNTTELARISSTGESTNVNTKAEVVAATPTGENPGGRDRIADARNSVEARAGECRRITCPRTGGRASRARLPFSKIVGFSGVEGCRLGAIVSIVIGCNVSAQGRSYAA